MLAMGRMLSGMADLAPASLVAFLGVLENTWVGPPSGVGPALACPRVGPPSGDGAAWTIGASANASADTMVMNTVF